MKLTVQRVSINTAKIEKRFDGVSKFMAVRIATLCDPYVPMQSGLLKNSRYIGDDYVRYPGPYAHFQYNGRVMVGAQSGSPWAKYGEPKIYTNRKLTYNGAPMRGPEWDKRMMIDCGPQLVKEVAERIGGTAK